MGAKEKADLTPNRIDVLALMWKRVKWIEEHIDKKQLKVNYVFRQRLYMIQVESGLCKNILFGLKDMEIDDLAEEIEKIKAHVGMVTE